MATAQLELDDSAINALQILCKDTRMNPSKAIQEAITAYRRQRANEQYLGTGLLDLSEDHPSETKRAVKKALKEKHGYSA
jgi:predicted transcriptional regulator